MKSPITPGEILLEEYLKPMGISTQEMARAIGVSQDHLEDIVQAVRPITPELSIRIGAFFQQSDSFWHGIQSECDVRRELDKKHELTANIRPAQSLVRQAANPALDSMDPQP